MRPPASDRDRPFGPSSPTKGRTLALVALVFVLVLALATLPWQRRQWDELARARREARLQEERLQDIKIRRDDAERLEAQLKNAPTDIPTRLEAARTFISRGESARGAALLQAVEREAEADPERSRDAALAGALSSLYERIGWQDKALALAEKAFRLEPDSVEALMRVAFLEAVLGWQKDCQAHVREAVRRAPGSAEPHLALALVLDQIGGLPDAEKELLEADRLRPDDWRIQLLLARNRMAQKRFDDALATLDRARTLAPKEASLVAARTDALLQKLERLPQRPAAQLKAAEDAAREYRSMAPDSPEARFLLGKALQFRGDDAGARREWEAVYQVQPDFGRLRVSLGTLLARAGERTRAAQLMDEAQKDQDTSNEFHRLVTAAGQQRDKPEPHRRLARHCQKHGRIPRAILEWQQVLKMVPGDREALEQIAAAKKLRGDLP